MVYVQCRDAVAELAEDVPETGRVGPAGDEACDLAALGDQAAPPDLALDEPAQLVGCKFSHPFSVPRRYRADGRAALHHPFHGRSNGPGMCPGARGESFGAGPPGRWRPM